MRHAACRSNLVLPASRNPVHLGAAPAALAPLEIPLGLSPLTPLTPVTVPLTGGPPLPMPDPAAEAGADVDPNEPLAVLGLGSPREEEVLDVPRTEDEMGARPLVEPRIGAAQVV